MAFGEGSQRLCGGGEGTISVWITGAACQLHRWDCLMMMRSTFDEEILRFWSRFKGWGVVVTLKWRFVTDFQAEDRLRFLCRIWATRWSWIWGWSLIPNLKLNDDFYFEAEFWLVYEPLVIQEYEVKKKVNLVVCFCLTNCTFKRKAINKALLPESWFKTLIPSYFVGHISNQVLILNIGNIHILHSHVGVSCWSLFFELN